MRKKHTVARSVLDTLSLVLACYTVTDIPGGGWVVWWLGVGWPWGLALVLLWVGSV